MLGADLTCPTALLSSSPSELEEEDVFLTKVFSINF